jgi:hypothetical protein
LFSVISTPAGHPNEKRNCGKMPISGRALMHGNACA